MSGAHLCTIKPFQKTLHFREAVKPFCKAYQMHRVKCKDQDLKTYADWVHAGSKWRGLGAKARAGNKRMRREHIMHEVAHNLLGKFNADGTYYTNGALAF